MSTRAVIFGFDDVLADTANVRIAAWQRTFRALGWAEPDESCVRGLTLDGEAFVAEVFARRKIDGGNFAGWAERQQGLVLQLLRDRPLLKPGVAALVADLRDAEVALAVLTPAPDDQVTTVLVASGLLDSFAARVTGPDAREADAERAVLHDLGVDPADAVALVARLADRDRAARAGLRAVVVTPTRPAEVDAEGWLADLADPTATRAALGL